MKLFYTLVLSFAIKAAFCCSCTPLFDFKSKDDLKRYDFISLVSVKELAPLDTVNTFMHLRTNGNIKVEVIEMFKGDKTNLIIDQNFSNDCAFNLQPNEQWIFFGNTYKGKTAISKCEHSVIYRRADGFRDWKYFTGIRQLEVLRNIYEHKLLPTQTKEFYPNGNVELKQSFKNGKLTGLRQIYYPNNQLYVAEKFRNGKRVNFRKCYTLSGQLERLVTYKKELIKQQINYQDKTENAWYLNYEITHPNNLLFVAPGHTASYFKKTLDSLRKLKHWEKQIRNIYSYSNDGRSYTNSSYNYKGDITTKGFLDWNKQLSETYHYYENGKIKYSVMLNQKANQEIEYDYDDKGKRRDFLKKCDACQFYFNKSILAASPEPSYIQ